MNISDFVKANAANRYLVGTGSGVQSSAAVGSTPSPGLQKAEKRIQTQVDSTTAQLSSVGKLKSSVSDAQLAARDLERLSATSTRAQEQAAANNFVAAFNKAIATAKTTATASGDASSTSQNASRVGRDLGRAVNIGNGNGNSANTGESLKKLGISQNTDGSLAIDAKKFEAAQTADAAGVRATLAQIGQQVETSATKALAAGGNVGASLSALTQRSSVLKRQQAALAAYQNS